MEKIGRVAQKFGSCGIENTEKATVFKFSSVADAQSAAWHIGNDLIERGYKAVSRHVFEDSGKRMTVCRSGNNVIVTS